MSKQSGSPEKESGPQKIALPIRGKTPNSPQKRPQKKKPGWLLPVGLIVFLTIGMGAIFLLKPEDENIIETEELVEENKPDEDTESPTRSFAVLTPEELKALQEQATQAVEKQAGEERAHKFQDILFGKAASLLADGDSAISKSEFTDAQIAFETVLETVDTLVLSYGVADEISVRKNHILELESTIQEKAASLILSEPFKSAQSELIASETLLQEGQFNKAMEKLKNVEAVLQSLIEEGEQRFQAALQEGLKALNVGDGETAKSHLAEAQDLRPNDPFIADQLSRAEVIDEVFEHFNQGLDFEQQGLYGSARVEYQKALELDPDSVNINTRLQAINQTLNKELFEEALNAGLASLVAGNGDASVESLQKAVSLMPADDKARNALDDARELQRRQLVDRLLTTAKKALADHDWDTAQISFRQVLDYEPSSSEAQVGLATAEEQIAREKQLKGLLREAETFEKNGEFEKALIVLREGRQVADPSGIVTEKIQFLERILDEKSKPQKVRILSDNQTDIQIYKIGKFKPSKELNLDLRPGEYTVIGTRLMYRDVRHNLVVEVGESPDPITVICQEKL